VGAPYFNLTFGPLMIPLLLLVPLGPMLTWKRASLTAVGRRLWLVAVMALAIGLAVLVMTVRGPWFAALGVGVGAWLILGALWELSERLGAGRVPLAAAWARLRGLPRAAMGMTLAHAGLGLALIGIFGVSFWRVENIVAMKPGDVASIGAYTVTFIGETPLKGPNYTGFSGKFDLKRDGALVTTLVSEKREFKPRGMPTTEVGLYQTVAGDVYLAMGDAAMNGGRSVRMYYNPLASFIWWGAAIMFLGGLLSLTDRRFRVGAPRRAAAPALSASEGSAA
jgi:cytochrome c-type biogenesis protein CcmF